MATRAENIDRIAGWLGEFAPDEQNQILKQVQLKAVNDTPADELLKAPISPLGEYLEMEIETPPEIVQPGVIVRGEIHVLTARAGKGKTTFLMNCMMRWAAGRPVFDDLPDLLNPGVEGGVKSLIIENEGSAGYFQDRMKDLLNNGGYIDEQKENIKENLLIWGDGSYSGVKVDDESKLELLRRGVKKHRPDLIFLDPFRSIWKGNENDNSEMNEAVDALMQLCHDFECAVFLNHHENKAKDNMDAMDASRGGTVFEGVVATMLRWQHVKNGSLSELSFSKMRYKPKTGAPAPIRMRFDFDTWTYEHVGESVLDRQILELLNETPFMTVVDLAEETDESDSKVRARLKKLVQEKRVQRIAERGTHKYRVRNGDTDNNEGGLSIG
jgi:hypothetical protein